MMEADHPDVRAFLARSMIVQVGTLSARGRPFLTPLWFVAHGGGLYLTTGAGTRAGKNVGAHPEVVLLFYGEAMPSTDRVLRLRGTASCRNGLPPPGVLLRLAVKYYLSPRALQSELRHVRQWRLRQAYYGQAKGGVGYIRVVPTGAELLPRP